MNDKNHLPTSNNSVEKNLSGGKNLFINSADTISLILENLSYAVFIHDSKGNFIFVNKKAIEFTGYIKEELLKSNVKDIDPKSFERKDEDTLWAKLKSGGVEKFFSEHVRKDGSIYYAEIDLTGINLNGKFHFMAIVQDVTERIKNQQIIRETNKKLANQLEFSEKQRKANLIVLGDLNKMTKQLKEEIEERKKTETALRESEFFVNAVANSTPALIYIYDYALQKNLWTNKRHKKFFGTLNKSGELEYKDVAERVHPDDFKVLLEETERMMNEKAEKYIDMEIRLNKDKKWIWMNLIISPFKFDDEGNITQIIGALFDITEKKSAALEILKFKTISDNAYHGNMITDLNNNIIYVNKYFAKLHRYDSAEELIGKNTGILHSKEQQNVFKSLNRTLLNSGKADSSEVSHIDKNGNEIPLLMISSVVKDENGKPLYFATTIIDIANLKEAQMAVKESEEKFRTAFKTSPDPLSLSDWEGTYLDINDGFTNILGYSENEVIGKSSLDLDIWKNPTERKKFIINLKNDGVVNNLEIEFFDKAGNTHQGLLSASLLEIHGKKVILSIARDVTQKKELEKVLIESERKYKLLFENQIEAYAYHEMIYDNKENPVDYRFIYVNSEFLSQTGAKSKESIIGKTVLEIWPNTDKFWIETYGRIAKTGEASTFEEYSTAQNKHYIVNAYSPKPGYFATSFMDITEKN